MTEKIKEIIKEKDIIIPKFLFLNYKKIGLTEVELIFVIYLLNNNIFNPKQISIDLGITLNEVMENMETLSSKGIIKLESKKTGNIRNENINLEGLYDKLTFNILNTEDKQENNKNIYDTFEKEFGRTISPMEYEIIGAWLENGTSEEIITLALKEATYNGVSNLRYIDKIISEWTKKGIKTKEDVEKSRMNFKQKKEIKEKNDILNYDWLNEE